MFFCVKNYNDVYGCLCSSGPFESLSTTVVLKRLQNENELSNLK